MIASGRRPLQAACLRPSGLLRTRNPCARGTIPRAPTQKLREPGAATKALRARSAFAAKIGLARTFHCGAPRSRSREAPVDPMHRARAIVCGVDFTESSARALHVAAQLALR